MRTWFGRLVVAFGVILCHQIAKASEAKPWVEENLARMSCDQYFACTYSRRYLPSAMLVRMLRADVLR
ncbi:MAG: hypothetical protein KDD25_10520, partial [Bdellovibrionales bacterium]|nr:hypothetical protein [Bdellovibrionales bacterium]